MEEIISAVGDGLTWLAAGGLGYAIALTAVQFSGSLYSERIRTFGQLQDIVEEEAEKLELTIPIQPYLINNHNLGHMEGYEDRVQLNVGGWFANRATVRHELYHLYKNHQHQQLENPVLDFLDYFFRKEFVCTLYGALGIKL